MAGFKDQMAMMQKLRKAQKELANELVEVEDVKIDPELIDLDNKAQLEGWIKSAIRDGLKAAQEVATEKMKPLMGGLGGMMGM